MSQIALSPPATGTGVFTISAPATNTNQTLTLPDVTGAALAIDSAGAVNNTSGVVNLGAGQVYKDASGNVGIGNNSPVGKLDIISGTARMFFSNQSATAFFTAVNTANSAYAPLAINGSELILKTGDTERARIDPNGNLLVGRTSAYSDGTLGTPLLQVRGSVGAAAAAGFIATTTGSIAMLGFVNPNGTVGTIVVSGSATSYNTSSDYRLKEFIAPMIGALDRVALLKPCTYKWKSDGSDGEGFIAHELQAVVPDCVTGTKDAVDAEGKPQYQGIDTSFLVATLTAAIQEQQAIIESLTARITALEGAN